MCFCEVASYSSINAHYNYIVDKENTKKKSCLDTGFQVSLLD